MLNNNKKKIDKFSNVRELAIKELENINKQQDEILTSLQEYKRKRNIVSHVQQEKEPDMDANDGLLKKNC